MYEQLLNEFVDRKDEVDTFCHMLDDGKRPVMVVWGPSGIGKSLLLARMIHECANRKLQKAKVLFRDEYLPDYLAILRTCRDDIGVDPFVPFTKKVREFFADAPTTNINIAGTVEVASDLVVRNGGSVGPITGVQVVVDPMTSEPRADLAVSEDERRVRLTATFLDCLADVAGRTMTVIFIDAVEKMPENTARWVWNDLIDGVTQRGANVRFVLSGQQKPKPGHYLKERIVRWSELKPLTESDVGEFLTKRGCPPDKLVANIKSAMATSELLGGEGYAVYVAMFADNMEARGW